jgi:hypothetical protein
VSPHIETAKPAPAEEVGEFFEAPEEVEAEEVEEVEEEEEAEPEPEEEARATAAELAADRARAIAAAETRHAASLVGKPDQKAEIEDKESVYDWLSAFGDHGEIIVTLNRTSPKNWGGVQTSGMLGNYDMDLNEEAIYAEHGGGKFQLKVYRKNAKGRREYVNARTFEIAGAPKLEKLRGAAATTGGNENPTLAGKAMDALAAVAESERRAAAEARAAGNNNQGMDLAAMQALNAPLLAQIQSLSEQNVALQARIFEMANKPADNSSQDKLFDIMSNKETSHGNDIQAIRASHDSELRQMREFNREEIKRRDARFEKELDHARLASTREIETLKLAHAQAMESQRLGYDMRIDSLKETQKRIDRELSEARTEVIALRAKKELSPLEQMQGVVELKNAFAALGPEEAEPKSVWEKAAEGAAPLIEAAAMRLAGAGGGEQVQAQEAEDPMVQVTLTDGRVTHMPRSQALRLRAQAEQQQAQHQEAVAQGTAINIDEASIKLATGYMENAFSNGISPEVFANSARSSIPGPILDHLKQHGVDVFLDSVSKIDASSRLATVDGRNYVRQVASYLLRGTAEVPSSP